LILDAKGSNVIGGDCTGEEVVCLGTAIGQCVNSKLVKVSDCAGGTSCFVLPLVNKPGTSVSCDTQADKDARFTAAGVQNDSPILPVSSLSATESSASATESSSASAVGASAVSAGGSTDPSGTNKSGDFVCIDDTQFKHFVSADKFVVESCPPGFCATRNPPSKNPCIGQANADRIDKKE
jgi:hypothetical protein